MATEQEELRLTVSLVDNASAGIARIRGEVSQITSGSTRAQIESFRRSQQEVAKQIKEVTDVALGGEKAMLGFIGKFGIAGAAIASMGVLAGTALASLKEWSESLADVGRKAALLGTSAADYQVLGRQFKEAHLSAEELDKALASINETTAAFNDPSSQMFQRLRELAGPQYQQTFFAMRQAFLAAPDAAQKLLVAKEAIQSFGRSAYEQAIREGQNRDDALRRAAQAQKIAAEALHQSERLTQLPDTLRAATEAETKRTEEAMRAANGLEQRFEAVERRVGRIWDLWKTGSGGKDSWVNVALEKTITLLDTVEDKYTQVFGTQAEKTELAERRARQRKEAGLPALPGAEPSLNLPTPPVVGPAADFLGRALETLKPKAEDMPGRERYLNVVPGIGPILGGGIGASRYIWNRTIGAIPRAQLPPVEHPQLPGTPQLEQRFGGEDTAAGIGQQFAHTNWDWLKGQRPSTNVEGPGGIPLDFSDHKKELGQNTEELKKLNDVLGLLTAQPEAGAPGGGGRPTAGADTAAMLRLPPTGYVPPIRMPHTGATTPPGGVRGGGDVNEAIRATAAAAGMDPAHWKAIADIESSLDPGSNRYAATQYKGLFQIGARGQGSEWARTGQGDVYNAMDNARSAARLAQENAAGFKKSFGRDPTVGEIYLMHQQGLGFYTRGAETNFAGNMPPSLRRAGISNPTHEQFEQGWTQEIERRAAKFGDSMPAPPTSDQRSQLDQSTWQRAEIDRAERRLLDAFKPVQVEGTGTLTADIRAPAGTRVGLEGGGLFRRTQLNRQTQMAYAAEGPPNPAYAPTLADFPL